METDVSSLEELLDRMAAAEQERAEADEEQAETDKEHAVADEEQAGAGQEHEKVTLDALLDAVGRRSFGPLLLMAGLITLAPLVGDIPGVPTIMGIFVVLTAGQLLFHRDHFWLPGWMLKRSVKRKKLCKALDWLRKPARWVDRWLKPRLTIFIRTAGVHVIAAVSVAIGLAMPAMEFVPFSANGAGAALTAFGLSLIADDGLLAVIALVITVGTFGFVGYTLLFS